MNRPIKFRAWSKKEKRFVYAVLTGTDIECSFNPDGVDGTEPQDTYLEELELEWWKEFTGLPDKNGKEIYEGDIVMQTNHGNPYPSAVVYSAPVFLFDDGSRLTTFIDEAEIIGNIYENPELLSV